MIMLTICFGAAYWYLAPDPFSVLAASALLILLVDPNSLWQISFQLTFVCMFAIFSPLSRSSNAFTSPPSIRHSLGTNYRED